MCYECIDAAEFVRLSGSIVLGNTGGGAITQMFFVDTINLFLKQFVSPELDFLLLTCFQACFRSGLCTRTQTELLTEVDRLADTNDKLTAVFLV